MEHPFEIIEACHDGGERDDGEREYEQRLEPAVGGSPKQEGKDQADDGGD